MWRTVFFISSSYFILNNSVKASYCDRLEQKNKFVPKERYVSIQDKLKNVSIYWSTNDNRAASALLVVLLRYLIGYQGVNLHQKPHKSVQENELVLALTDPSQAPGFLPNIEDYTRINCSDHISFGLRQFYVHIPHKFRNLKQCVNAPSWSFYNNFTALKDCGFFPTIASGNNMNETDKYVDIYTLNKDSTKIIEKLSSRVVPVRNIIQKGCLDILQMLTTSKHSFLFYDDEIWSGNPDVSKLQLPSCKDLAHKFIEDTNTAINIRFVNASLILEYAPSIYQLGNIEIPLKYVKVILEKENIREDIEEAACEWALKNIFKVRKWTEQNYILHENQYSILHFYDANDNDDKLYKTLPMLLAYKLLPDNFDSKTTFTVGFYYYSINFRNSNYIKDVIDNFMKDNTCLTQTRQQIIGAVVGVKQNIFNVIQAADDIKLPIFLYDHVGVDIKPKKSMWFATGTSFHLALALQNFVFDMNWTRVDVLSESTEIAENFYKDLEEVGGFKIQNYRIQSEILHHEADKLILEIRKKNTRIIFLNTNYEKALMILTVAERLEMNNDFVWIVRDWQPHNNTYNLTCIHFSFLSENIKYVKKNDGWLELRLEMKNTLWPNTEWPDQAPVLVDALLTLVKGFEATFRRYPQIRHDVHSELAIREFEKSIAEEKILGVTQNLTYNYKRRMLEDIVVILEEWHGERSELLARYRVYITARVVNVENTGPDYFKYAETYDNETITKCFIFNGYIYQKICYDVLMYALLGILITIIILYLMVKIVARPHYQRVNRSQNYNHGLPH